jgi:hypothetical protein
MRTQKAIDRQIAVLKKLKPMGAWKTKTTASIQAVINELGEPFDRTALEWNELSDSERDIREQVERWKDGYNGAAPSKGWGGLVE